MLPTTSQTSIPLQGQSVQPQSLQAVLLTESAERVDYSSRYWESTQETLVGLYGKRDNVTGLPVESINDIIHRVAEAVAVAELKYALTPQEIIDICLDDALGHPKVMQSRKTFADCIG